MAFTIRCPASIASARCQHEWIQRQRRQETITFLAQLRLDGLGERRREDMTATI